MVYDAIQSDAKEIVTASAGAGAVSTSLNHAVEDILNHYGIPVVQSMQTNSGEVPLSDVSTQTATHIARSYLDLRTLGSWSACFLLKEKNMAEIAIAVTGSVDD